ncbi:Hypothetical_protein [Hexamita inflata]|uniref:Hypothetical_protein n=1 Tax=Hexamita inflata TaxID=28002 RepID=A0AA86RIK6_9EUKA|nr:Hypothetical protein HINF_LOCUS64887 [Hexamita inflata]
MFRVRLVLWTNSNINTFQQTQILSTTRIIKIYIIFTWLQQNYQYIFIAFGGLGLLFPHVNYDAMHQDMTNKIIIDAQSHKEAHNLQQGVAQHYFREERLKVKAKELQQNTVDDSVPKTGYALLDPVMDDKQMKPANSSQT